MKKTIIATTLIIGLTTGVAFAAGNPSAQTVNDGKAASHDMAQMNTPANNAAKMPMNGHNMGTMPMTGHDMSKMMAACMTMMNQHGMNTK